MASSGPGDDHLTTAPSRRKQHGADTVMDNLQVESQLRNLIDATIVAANMPAQQKAMTANELKSSSSIFVPDEKEQYGRLMKMGLVKVAPSLQDLSMKSMAANSDEIASLEGVPDILRHKLTHLVCQARKMNLQFLELIARGSPSEIRVRDCSWLNAEQFTKMIENTDTSQLTVLQLDQCGRCFQDLVVFHTLAHSPSKFSALINVSLKGACRLSNDGLNALVAAMPTLRSINLGSCLQITPDGIMSLANKLGPVLKELYIDHCVGLDDECILPALMKLTDLEVLSISHFKNIKDSFVVVFVAGQGQKIKELVLADCTDEAVASYLEAHGRPLKELSLNNVQKVGIHTATSLGKHAKHLHCLDLSWCGDITEAALRFILDGCQSLKFLKLFGCFQITDMFMDRHSNKEVNVMGLKGVTVLKYFEVPDYYPTLKYSSV